MRKIKRVREIYDDRGAISLARSILRYIYRTTFPKPTVSDSSTLLPFWTLKYLYNFSFNIKYSRGVDIMEEDWDTLILLDACRFDDFKNINHIDGDLKSKISKGVDSKEFILRNFSGRNLHDTVYVTANPHVSLVDDNVFHEIVSEPISQWDSDLQCVKPNDVTAAAIKAHNQYPDKRIIVHYMQPHDPPLGPTATKLRDDFQIDGAVPGDNNSSSTRIMELVAAGEIPKQEAHQAYKETLEVVLEEVDVLLENIAGKIVISSDHGEMFGEKPYLFLGNLYEHYRNPRTITLCKVPWLVVNIGPERRNITSDKTNDKSPMPKDNQIHQQLEALGYK
jgi:hypothetical protein